MVAPSVLGVFAMAQTTLADETESQSEILDQVETYHNGGASLDQVNSVFQLRDVSPGDWAFEALRNLVERYGCIAGYPDGTFRGNRALTRYEFAAGLNACLQQIERLIAANTGGSGDVNQGDLATLQRLTQEFEAELATLGTRVDNLEGRVGFLEDNQFSTTTKLNGSVVFDLAVAGGDQKAVGGQAIFSPPGVNFDNDNDDVEEGIHFTNRVRINLDSSFTGRDRLRTRLETANNITLGGATGASATARNLGAGGGGIRLDQLMYSFPVGDNIIAHVGATGVLVDDIFDAGSTASFAYGSINLFTAYNNLIYDVSSSDSAGFGANIVLNDLIQLDLGYFTGSGATDPDEGLFGGNYSAGAQLGFDFGEVDLSLAYLRSYQVGGNLSGFVGSPAAATPFPDDNGNNLANSADHFGVHANWRVSQRFSVGGYFGLVDAQTEVEPQASAEIVNWLVNTSFPDLGKEGSVLILAFGQPPKLTDSGGDAEATDPDTGYLLNLEYQYPINNNISIVPGGYVLFNPDHNDNNDTIYVGRLRTLFSF
ncbi:putative S-layer protein [Dactylococcopsis salina PCC 8305]|uniref:S-layer protein n=2 Tax=Dactylococcopsis salina TaxID=292566 RepID=K9YV66_DACS8|nr:putative S-layer protein [Dactylococcopsis salina PCC 8305]